MLYSYGKKFIFIHVPKTAGTSIQHCLEPYVTGDMGVERHAPAFKVRKKIGEQEWVKYFKFAFVRNPWDWMVSIYHYIKEIDGDPRQQLVSRMSFTQFVRWFDAEADPRIYPARHGQKMYLEASGEIIVDFIGRVESIDHDFKQICRTLGLPEVTVPIMNTTQRDDYHKYYNAYTRERVGQMFARDVGFFKYEY